MFFWSCFGTHNPSVRVYRWVWRLESNEYIIATNPSWDQLHLGGEDRFTGARQHMYGTPVNYVPTPKSTCTKLPNSAAMRDASIMYARTVLHIDIVMYIEWTTCCPWER